MVDVSANLRCLDARANPVVRSGRNLCAKKKVNKKPLPGSSTIALNTPNRLVAGEPQLLIRYITFTFTFTRANSCRLSVTCRT